MPVNTDGPELSGIEHRLTVLETRVENLINVVNGLASTVASKADLESLTSVHRADMQLLRKDQQADTYKALYRQMWKLYVYGAGLVGVAFFIGRDVV